MATTGPMPMISGGTPPMAKLTKRAVGFRPSSRALRLGHDQRGRRAVAGLRRVAGRDRALRVKHGLELGQRFERWCRRAGLRPYRKRVFWSRLASRS